MRNIETIGVVGAGLMGSGIAQVCAMAGLNVVLRDISEEAVQGGVKSIASLLERAVGKGKLSAAEKDAALSRIHATTDLAQLSNADFIIEAATENPELKLRILKEVDSLAKADAIIATNTSSISITKLGGSISRPHQFVGMHFFNPVPVMELVELIRGIQTSDETVAAAEALALRIGKKPIQVKNSPGFAVNRILVPMINEAIFVLQEGLATPEDIDAGMKLGCNHPIGPLALAD
ncbi:MAG TPA: 3-hydroxyacyl-CoA dehydrogenase NAD-binding domain-containing protein, partial [Noviherbaspirillum sp.]|nr:3-hydroxyacyl-CoA dehydrogenase NAD-binding domain-containing protein [Noviherbaspirillum sp.]